MRLRARRRAGTWTGQGAVSMTLRVGGRLHVDRCGTHPIVVRHGRQEPHRLAGPGGWGSRRWLRSGRREGLGAVGWKGPGQALPGAGPLSDPVRRSVIVCCHSWVTTAAASAAGGSPARVVGEVGDGVAGVVELRLGQWGWVGRRSGCVWRCGSTARRSHRDRGGAGRLRSCAAARVGVERCRWRSTCPGTHRCGRTARRASRHGAGIGDGQVPRG